jgi:Resolvase, N terminal domain/Recombinase
VANPLVVDPWLQSLNPSYLMRIKTGNLDSESRQGILTEGVDLDSAGLMDLAKRQGWQLVVLDLAVDTTTPSGQLMANVLASFSEYERQLIGQRTSAALQQKKASGARLGRPRTMDPAVTARIVHERQAGMSLPAIARGLNEDGVPTARGGRAWMPGSVCAVLRSAELDIEALAKSQ